MKAGEKPSSRSPSSKPAVSRNVCLWQGGGGGRGGGRGGGLEAAWSTHGMHSETSCISLPVLSFGGTWYSWASPPNDSGNKHLSSLPHLVNADRHTGRAPTLPFPPKDSCHCTDGGGGWPTGVSHAVLVARLCFQSAQAVQAATTAAATSHRSFILSVSAMTALSSSGRKCSLPFLSEGTLRAPTPINKVYSP